VLSVSLPCIKPEEAHPPDLLAQAQAGDAEAFCALCRSYETRLFRQALALCADATLSEDLAQETLVEAWKCLRRYNGRCQFFTWLCAILFNRYRNTLRTKRPFPFSLLGGPERESAGKFLENLPDEAGRPDQIAQESERNSLLRLSIAALSSKHREIIYMRFYVDDSLENIAEALNCSLGTVKSRLFNALEKLRAMEDLNNTFGKEHENDL
jgi:RNA polymerase sigma-70 factor (ECF subfamily)